MKTAWAFVIAGMMALLAAVPHAAGTTPSVFFVDLNGLDTNACTQTSPCKTLNHTYQVASPGDTVLVAKGDYPTNVIRGTKSGGSCGKHVGEGGCITFEPMPGLVKGDVTFSALSFNADLWKAKNFVLKGSFNFQGDCPGIHHDGIAENIDGAQLGMFGGFHTVWVKDSYFHDRRNDASQMFACAFDSVSERPADITFEASTIAHYHLTSPLTCANGAAGFQYKQPTAVPVANGSLAAGTYTYTVRLAFRSSGNRSLYCMFPQVSVTLPQNGMGVRIDWTDPNPNWKAESGFDVFGRSGPQAAQRKLVSFVPATIDDPSRTGTTSWTDLGSSSGSGTAGPINDIDVHMECWHIDGWEGYLRIVGSVFGPGCGEYNISWSNNGGGGPGSWFKGPLTVENTIAYPATGGDDVAGGPGTIAEMQISDSAYPQTIRFVTFAGHAGLSIDAQTNPQTSVYGNLLNWSVTSFGCNFAGQNSAHSSYNISLSTDGGVACGPGSSTVPSIPLGTDEHLTSCTAPFTTLIPGTVPGGYPAADIDGDMRADGSPDVGADECATPPPPPPTTTTTQTTTTTPSSSCAPTCDQQIADLNAQVATLQRQLDDGDATITDLRRQLVTAQGYATDLQSQLSQANGEVADLTRKLADAQQQINDLQARIDKAVSDLGG